MYGRYWHCVGRRKKENSIKNELDKVAQITRSFRHFEQLSIFDICPNTQTWLYPYVCKANICKSIRRSTQGKKYGTKLLNINLFLQLEIIIFDFLKEKSNGFWRFLKNLLDEYFK